MRENNEQSERQPETASGRRSGWRSGEGSQLAQKVAFGLGAALLAGTAVTTVPAGPGVASRDGYTVTSVTLSAPINSLRGPGFTTCCPPSAPL